MNKGAHFRIAHYHKKWGKSTTHNLPPPWNPRPSGSSDDKLTMSILRRFPGDLIRSLTRVIFCIELGCYVMEFDSKTLGKGYGGFAESWEKDAMMKNLSASSNSRDRSAPSFDCSFPRTERCQGSSKPW